MAVILQFDADKQRVVKVKRGFQRLVAELVGQGYHPAQILMDIADIADAEIRAFPTDPKRDA
jgi:hypothetical protein